MEYEWINVVFYLIPAIVLVCSLILTLICLILKIKTNNNFWKGLLTISACFSGVVVAYFLAIGYLYIGRESFDKSGGIGVMLLFLFYLGVFATFIYCIVCSIILIIKFIMFLIRKLRN